MAEQRRILVVGGGIGGLCVTIALGQAGDAVDVVEKNPAWDVYGVGIIQPANALRALDSLGLADQAVRDGFAIVGVALCDRDGHEFMRIPNPQLVDHLPGMNGITRPRLHAILQRAALDTHAQVRPGVTVTSLSQDADTVQVEFSDATSGVYDLVIGADGVRSQIRETVFGSDVQPQRSGQVVWRYNLPRPPEIDHLIMQTGPYGRAGVVPLAPDLMYLLHIESDRPDALDPREAPAAAMRESLEPYGGLIGELRDAVVDDEGVVVRPVETLLVPLPWSRGRVALLGDAAHATSPHAGQGAAQAIEDAVVLAEELQRTDSVPDALLSYGARRYERCKMVIEKSLQIGENEMVGDPDSDPTLPAQIAGATAAPI